MRGMGPALLAAMLISCAGGAAPPATPRAAAPASAAPAAAPTAPTAPAGPTAERLAFWKDLHARGDAPPPGADLAALSRELVEMLGSPDPEVRDRIAYEVLAAWINRPGLLPPATLRELRDALLARLREPPGKVGDDSVYGRSFSALVLAEVARREIAAPTMSDAELGAMVEAARAYAAAETDLRGRDDARGWAHAAAHTADWLKLLARDPRLGRARGQLVLDAVLDLTVRRHGFVLHDGEDGRLAQPVLELLRRGHVDRAMFAAFVDKLLAPLRVQLGATWDGGLYAAQRNARNLAFTLFVQLSLEEKPGPAITQALAALTAAMKG